jgi:hypothetical protein
MLLWILDGIKSQDLIDAKKQRRTDDISPSLLLLFVGSLEEEGKIKISVVSGGVHKCSSHRLLPGSAERGYIIDHRS